MAYANKSTYVGSSTGGQPSGKGVTGGSVSPGVKSFEEDDISCTERCRSREHGRKIWEIAHGAVDIEVICLWMKTCQNYSQVKDDFGRTALHAAASSGNLKAVEWILKTQQCNINAKELISGYSPLHRSIYFGHLHVARALIKHGADLNIRDNEGLTPFEMCQMDRPIQFKQNPGDMTELTVWGSNANYNLGLGHQQPRLFPDVALEFRRSELSLAKVSMNTYHTVFLTQTGKVLVCGYGMGGRLGTGEEGTVLTPTQITLRGNGPCKDIAVGQDHSIFLTDTKVWTVGSNENGQLGHDGPVPISKLITPRTVSSLTQYNITGVLAGNFHSTFYNSEVILMCGLNQGQFGRGFEEDGVINSPTKLNLHLDNVGNGPITSVGGNDYATAIVIEKRYIFLLRRHQYARIDSKNTTSHEILKIEVSGEKNQITVFILTGSGRVLVWRENYNKSLNEYRGAFTRLVFSNSRLLDVKDFSVSLSSLIVITNTGEAYKAGWSCNNAPSIVGKMDEKFGQVAGTDFQVAVRARKGKRDDEAPLTLLELMKIKRVPNVHTALLVSSDVKGNNFSILQRHQMMDITDIPEVVTGDVLDNIAGLYAELQEGDQSYDVLFRINDYNEFPAHAYILASASPVFFKVLNSAQKGETGTVLSVKVTNKLFSVDPVKCASMEDLNVFRNVLEIIYTRSCSFITVEWMQTVYHSDGPKDQQQQQKKKGRVYETKMKELSKFRYLLRGLQLDSEETAIQRFYNDVERQWDAVVIKETCPATVNLPEYWKDLKKMSFNRTCEVGEAFADVILKASDKKEFFVHKCILIARMEYYKSLFSCNWAFMPASPMSVASKQAEDVALSFSSNSVEILLECIYRNEAPSLSKADIETMCETVACADFVMNDKLLQLAESEMTRNISLKNVADVTTFAWKHNAGQLKNTCFDFISLNLTSILENRLLDNLSVEILTELSAYYRCSQKEKLLFDREKQKISNVPEIEDYELAMQQTPQELLEQVKEIETADGSFFIRKTQGKPARSRVRLRSRTFSETETAVLDVEESFVETESPKTPLTLKPRIENTPPVTPNPLPASHERKLVVPLPMNRCFETKKSEDFPSLISTAAHQKIIKPLTKLNVLPSQLGSPPSRPTLGNVWNQPSTKETPEKQTIMSPRESAGTPSPVLSTPTGNSGSGGKKKTKWRTISTESDIPKKSTTVVQEKQAAPQFTSDGRDRNNPWKKAPSKSDQVVFRTIVEDEVEKKRNFEKATTKALPLMQIEDEAINFLTKRYTSEDTIDYIELLTVERVVTQNFSTPVWVQQHPGAITAMSCTSYPKFKR